MIDPQDLDLPLDEMSLAFKAPTPVSPSWRELWTYEKETHPAFHTVPDYHNALHFLLLRYPHWRECLNDWSKN